MSRLRDQIAAERENIQANAALLPDAKQLPYLSPLELGGVAGILNSFYNGAENILKQILLVRGMSIPKGESWHRDLLLMAETEAILPIEVTSKLKVYLAFRHFFTHAYALDVEPHRMVPLVEDLPGLFERLKSLQRDIG